MTEAGLNVRFVRFLPHVSLLDLKQKWDPSKSLSGNPLMIPHCCKEDFLVLPYPSVPLKSTPSSRVLPHVSYLLLK